MNIPELKTGPDEGSLDKHIENSQEVLDSYAVYMNQFYDKKLLTRVEAIQLINHLSGALLVNECQR